MGMTPILPQAFWFRFAAACPHVDGIPKAAGPRLLDLPEACRLPDTTRLDGKGPWADVRVGWSAAGFAVQVEADGELAYLSSDDRPEAVYGMQLWVDTRDTRNVSRATRFCHRFDLRLERPKGGAKTALAAQVHQRPIARAVADAPIARAADFDVRVARTKGGWRAELWFPAAALKGFDPETNRRLGFAYRVFDPDRDDQWLGAGREFPVGENPSLWSTLELRDAD